jgi:ankyrin repeat protein
MAMGKQLLRMLVERGGPQSYFLNPIVLAIKECEGLFSRTGYYDNTYEVREIYLNGILETYTGLMGYAVLIHFVSHLEEDCLDDRQKSKDEKEHDWMYVILMAAAYLGRIRDLKHLITLGLDVNRNHEATWLYPPLIAASFSGQETAARVVVEHGADPHTVMRSNDSSNENAIHFAALFGHSSLIQFLVGHGVNPRLESLKSDTPRIWAAAAGNPDVVRILLTYYIDVPEKCRQLEAALDWAANRGYSDVVVEILRDPDSKYSHTAPLDSAPLAGAAIMGREDVVQALLSDPYVMGKECTIFWRALSAGETTTVRTMIDSNRKMLEEYQIVYSETAVHTAIDSGKHEMASPLLVLVDFPINYKRTYHDSYPTLCYTRQLSRRIPR